MKNKKNIRWKYKKNRIHKKELHLTQASTDHPQNVRGEQLAP